MRTREEQLEWSKERAREYLRKGDLANAMGSFMSDMDKHPETKIPTEGALAQLTYFALLSAGRGDYDFVSRYIEGFR